MDDNNNSQNANENKPSEQGNKGGRMRDFTAIGQSQQELDRENGVMPEDEEK